ncbi:hypothetical protein HK102_012454 [Quaeritorhiza haematococci]|nr:hypothetical protein HK102_012454 [Quaeritorhiza haematococci]
MKFGAIAVSSQSLDLCNVTEALYDQFGVTPGVDPLECPIAPGYVFANVTMRVPSSLPRVTYNFRVSGRNGDGKQIACIQGVLTIPIV